ncbi:MAG: hypothetical protein EOP88_16330 [Verrucomicrobiaceae bacterium]|nr:MAG: hypothetical protein EOP88_16330 [Verrucomicrobiaceae bacterium]
MRTPSIRRNLLLRCGAGTGVLLCVLSAGVYLLVRQSLYRELDESIEQTATLLANQVEYEDYSINFEWKEGIGTNRSLTEYGLFQFWDEKTGNTTRSPGLGPHDLPRFTGIEGRPLLRNITLADGNRGRAIGLRVVPFVMPEEYEKMKATGFIVDPKTLPHVLVVARDAEQVHHTLERLRWVLALGGLTMLGLGFLLIQRIVGVSLRPIDDMTAQMRERAEHQLDSALVVPGELPVELTGLAQSFDSLLSRVAAIRQRERDFIRHAAHELRTPIAGLRATTDLALSQQRDAPSYRGHLETCQSTAIELGELVKRLSALSRVGATGNAASLDQIDVTQVLAGCLESFAPLFEQRGLAVNRDVPSHPLIATADPTLLRIIINNLLDNAGSYSPSPGELRIRAALADNRVELRFANRSDDLPDNLERLFEPLFRKESSRNDSASHLGIGLTLSLEAATAMGATLRAEKRDGGWIEFILVIPSGNVR